jgi:hypothetical protein
MSFWANVVLGKCLLGKRLMGKCPSRQMSFWANVFWADVFWANVVLGKCLCANVSGQMSYGQMSGHQRDIWTNWDWSVHTWMIIRRMHDINQMYLGESCVTNDDYCTINVNYVTRKNDEIIKYRKLTTRCYSASGRYHASDA